MWRDVSGTQSGKERSAPEWERVEALPAAQGREQEQAADHEAPRDGHIPRLGYSIRYLSHMNFALWYSLLYNPTISPKMIDCFVLILVF